MMDPEHRYFVLHKPHDMVSQFVSPDAVNLLTQINFSFPDGTHAIGRLDKDSEGLLLLTTDKRVTNLLFNSAKLHKRTYLVQVRHFLPEERLEKIRNGVGISSTGGSTYITRPCEVSYAERPDWLTPGGWEVRPDLPHAWASITLTEGKFRQVRKMFDAVGNRVMRLVRVSIEDLDITSLPPGEVKELSASEFFSGLHIDPDGDG
ncbi:pseudouridine synthase [Flavihumibacter sediminis]|nr:pseudouridine synthase [Flavihumibacter sediminis]